MLAYSQDFQQYATQLNLKSARIVTRWLQSQLAVASVADFGCAQGAWLMAWQEQGVTDVIGIDGDYVERQHLVIDPARFIAYDLAAPLNLQRRFSLVQCLEVAEHLPATAATVLIDNLTRHAPLVLFSAAPPGQGGMHHINEQPYSYWGRLFETHDYVLLDVVRPVLRQYPTVQPWYRYNVFLFAQRDYLPQLPPAFLPHQRQTDQIPEVAPGLYRLRCRVIQGLPYSVQQQLAVVAEQVHLLKNLLKKSVQRQ